MGNSYRNRNIPKMYPKSIQRLIELFTKFPGIGPRQASRFVFYILKNKALADDLVVALRGLNQIDFCDQCFRSMDGSGDGSLCLFCRDPKRNHSLIAIVEKESDMQNLEKTGAYHGLYHILGGLISPLDSESSKRLHLKEFYTRIKNVLDKSGACEVVLATNPTTEGDITSLYIERILVPLKEQHSGLKISRLGRGLSLGSELEYADEITLKNALTNRK